MQTQSGETTAYNITLITVILLSTTAYATLRYVGFGDVSITHLPVYLLNKSIAMSAVICLCFASLQYLKNQDSSWMGRMSWHLIGLHVLLSLAILSRDYYPKFFDAAPALNKMNLTGESTILFGVLAIYCFWRLNKSWAIFKKRKLLLCLSTLLVMAHLFTMGIAGWLKPATWNGGMPSISLISFGLALISFGIFIYKNEESK